ncbi:uncharacterized protein LOC117152478 isoform X4 [Bombus impatiens]|uniref:Uncharacterized protein LOC117152478 isoform X4 n=1 Tax=Bombus impatiens TaxID=132113 RepID=A0A6P8M4K5_BOMIM|nr:uncharacterized protein LOC117152478 isoform X4 [Bombus impatiens]
MKISSQKTGTEWTGRQRRNEFLFRLLYLIVGVARVAVITSRCRPTRERNQLFIRQVSQLFTGRDNVGDGDLTQRKLYIFERNNRYIR